MQLSVVIPVYNEVDNVAPLAKEVQTALSANRPFEIIFVDDGSTDGTAGAVLGARGAGIPEIRLLQHGWRCGQSRALMTGIGAARAEWVATLDGDGQNDPADIPVLLAALAADRADLRLVMGHRTSRRDSWLRRVSARLANHVRARVLRDGTPDTGCGIKLIHRETFLGVPHFDHIHRFLPALFQREGARVTSVPVRSRPRLHVRSKYGVHNRLWVGIVDLFGVRWLMRRTPQQIEVTER